MYNLHVLPLSFLTQSKLLKQWAKSNCPKDGPQATAILQALHSALASSREDIQTKLITEGGTAYPRWKRSYSISALPSLNKKLDKDTSGTKWSTGTDL
jgi:hypothetical protein